MSACADRLDALHVHLVEGDARAEGQAGQQGELVGGVEAADVEGGVGLGIALGLRLLQHVGEGAVLLLHLRQDVVAGAVEDAVDAPDLVAGQRLAQRLDDGDAAGHRRLEVEGDAVLLGQLGELGAVLGEQRLVGGDDVLAGRQRRLHRALGGPVLAADQLDEDVDRGVGGEPRRRRRTTRCPRERRHASWCASAPRRPRPRCCGRRCGRAGRRARPSSCSSPVPTVPRPAMPNFSGRFMPIAGSG